MSDMLVHDDVVSIESLRRSLARQPALHMPHVTMYAYEATYDIVRSSMI